MGRTYTSFQISMMVFKNSMIFLKPPWFFHDKNWKSGFHDLSRQKSFSRSVRTLDITPCIKIEIAPVKMHNLFAPYDRYHHMNRKTNSGWFTHYLLAEKLSVGISNSYCRWKWLLMVCWIFYFNNFNLYANCDCADVTCRCSNSVDPDQTAPFWAVYSGSTMFAIKASKVKQQTTIVTNAGL